MVERSWCTQAVLCPAIDRAGIATVAGAGSGSRGGGRFLRRRVIAEDGAKLHDHIEELQAVDVRQPLDVLIYVGVVQLPHQLR